MAVRTINAMPLVPYGVAHTCEAMVAAGHREGVAVDLCAIRRGRTAQPAPYRLTTAPGGAILPFPLFRDELRRLLERRYLRRIREGDIAYLWPSVSARLFERLKTRGIPIVMETVNTRMRLARLILDAAYDALDLPATHGLTDARIADQEARFDMADAIFSPSPTTDAALAEPPVAPRVIPASYGTFLDRWTPRRPGPSAPGRVTFLFVGSACVRKGAHVLFDIWDRTPPEAHLHIVGTIEPALARRYAPVLGGGRIALTPFTRQVAPHYTGSDVLVLPTLEEGDPIVTYEAAASRLPILTTAAGSGRIGGATGCCLIHPAGDREALLEAILRLVADPDLREDLGARALAAAADYDWSQVAARRFRSLEQVFGAAALSRAASPRPSASG